MRRFRTQFAWLFPLLCAVCQGPCAGQEPPSKSSSNSRQVASLVDQGIADSREGRFSQAEAAYRRALAIDPHCLPAKINLGLAYFKSADYGHAIPPLQQAASQGVDTEQVHTLLAMSFYALHQYEPASRQFEVLFERQPGNIMLQYLLAESYMRSHQTDPLPALLGRMQAATPDSPVIYMLAGEQYDRLGQTDKAIAELLKAEAIAPEMPMVHFALGYFYWEERLTDKSQAEFQAETQIKDGEAAQAKGFLGDLALNGGDDAKAEQLLRESVTEDAQVRIAQYDLGVISARKHDSAAAVRYFQAAIALDPQRADAYYRLATLYRELGEHDRQREMLAKVEQLHKVEHTTPAEAMAAPAKNTQ
ncbi:MAG: tetratricopeptide repeat protein [Acidobacteriaceae bacterium]